VNAESLVIVGAGDHGRGTLEIVKACNAVSRRWNVAGFIDDAPERRGASVDGRPVLGGVEWIAENHRDDLRYVLAIANCRTKKKLADRLADFGLVYANIVHPMASVADSVKLCGGDIVASGVVVAYDTVIGPHVTLNMNSTIGHDCRLGQFTTVAPGANVAGRVTVGTGCDIGPNCTIGKGITLGEWSFVGPGTVVIKELAAGQRVFGNPARLIP
jgi:sugar O-acyltransferase (sialic acid O-acetyltransferase NeuD family)